MEFFKKYKKQMLVVLCPILVFGGGFCYGGIVLLMDVQKGLLVAGRSGERRVGKEGQY